MLLRLLAHLCCPSSALRRHGLIGHRSWRPFEDEPWDTGGVLTAGRTRAVNPTGNPERLAES